MMRHAQAAAVWLCATLAVILLFSSVAQRGRKGLYHRDGGNGRHAFVIADEGRVVLAQQNAILAPGAAMRVDASAFGAISITHADFVLSGRRVTAEHVTMQIDPISMGMRSGFLWLNLGTIPVGPSGLTLTYRAAGVPMWVLAIPLLLPATISILRHARVVRRIKRGFCPQCGYDLRESPDRCPECGLAA
jgi:hypothetical protein